MLRSDINREFPELNSIQLTRLVSVMYQFSDRTKVSQEMLTPYANIIPIFEAVTDSAHDNGPVSYGEQFEIVLREVDNVPSAIWNLFMTNRQYARWRDSDSIDYLPNLTRQQKMARMHA